MTNLSCVGVIRRPTALSAQRRPTSASTSAAPRSSSRGASAHASRSVAAGQDRSRRRPSGRRAGWRHQRRVEEVKKPS